MDVQDYLDRYYWDTAQLAEQNGLSSSQIHDMVAAESIPKPSYVVEGRILKSVAFGDLDAQAARKGEYFPPATSHWIARARNLGGDKGRETLKQIFFENMTDELADLDRNIWRLSDTFNDCGNVLPKGLQQRLDSYWTSFLAGIFGLCVANPVSEREIARKEIMQEKLTAITENGAKFSGLDIARDALVELIDAYEHASMPFSPVEYPISSRKRLVDDLRAKIALAV